MAESWDETNDDITITGVRLSKAQTSPDKYGADPFSNKLDKIRSTYKGLSKGTKRKMTLDLQKAYNGVDDSESKQINYDITGYDAFRVIQPPYNLDYLAALFESSSPHYAAIRAKTACIVGLGFSLVESPKTKMKMDALNGDESKMDAARRKISRARGLLLDKIDSFNNTDTFLEVLSKVWVDYEATGNGYLEIGRTTTGEIGYIGQIPATTMRVRRERDGFVQIVSNKVVFFRNFQGKTPDPIGGDSRPNEIIHIKKYTPTNGYYGIPDIIAAKVPLAGNDFAAKFNLDYFENKAVPRHLIILQGANLSEGGQRAVMEFFETNLSGQNHRSLYVPLPGDTETRKVRLTIQPIEAGAQDASFIKYTSANMQEILMAHRVPISKIGTPMGVSLANARDADKTFSEQVCQPEQEIFEKKLNKILAEFTDAFLIDLNQMSLTDALTQATIDEKYLRNDTRTPNEIRADHSWPGINNGDKTVGAMAQITAGKKVVTTTQQVAQQTANATQNRERDAARASNQPDNLGEGRQPKGDGRVAE